MDEGTLEDALAKLDGPVSIDWSSLSGKDNLESDWVADRWQDLVEPIRKQEWGKALKILGHVREEGDARDMIALLRWLAKEEHPSEDDVVSDFLLPVKEEALKGTPLAIWLHRIEIPSKNKLLGSRPVVLKQARSGFARAYLGERFRRHRRTEAFHSAVRLPLHKTIVSSKVAHRHTEGLSTTVWVCHVVNLRLLDHQLAVAGLMKRAKADFVLAIAVDGDEPRLLKSKLFRLFGRAEHTFRRHERCERGAAKREGPQAQGEPAPVGAGPLFRKHFEVCPRVSR